MNEKVITSRDNPLVRRARAVRDGKITESIFIEGLRLCEEAVSAGLSIEAALYTDRLLRDQRGSQLIRNLRQVCDRVLQTTEPVLASVSDTKNPQGILILATRPRAGTERLALHSDQIPLLVILHRINNPANAGAILRTAEAAGATAAILTAGTTDIFSPKALRGAMGSSFRLPLWTGPAFSEALAWCAERRILTVCADIRGTRAHTEIDWTIPRAVIVGAEAAGLDTDEIAAANDLIRIPMCPPVDSLNVAVASAIILYEAARQRTEGRKQ